VAGSDERSQRRWLVLTGVAASLPLVPIVLGLVIGSGGAGAARVNPAAYRPLAATPRRPVARERSLPPGSGALVALVHGSTTMRDRPDGRALHLLGPRTEYGSPTALWVIAQRPGWLGVVSPLAGNGGTGWIVRNAVSLARVDWELRVSLSGRRLTVLEAGRPLERYTVAIGRPSAPTPTGRFAVTDRLAPADPSGPYGCCILALSAVAPHAIQGWNGGSRIAIHSTSETATIGQPVSHGCLRLTIAEGRWLLAHIPLGTPTLISS
jgi:lipoprotein-anchoring transpeptidase ErfK/SrfK